MLYLKQTDAIIADLVVALKAGQTIVYPTETCYGLGCDATNAAAVEKIFSIKQRQKEKSVLVICSDVGMAKKYLWWSSAMERISQKYWPGPVTVVGRAIDSNALPGGVIRQEGTLAVRVTAYPFAAELCKKLGVPLVSTSANISSQENPYDVQSILSMFSDTQAQPDILIDAGVLPKSPPSTVVMVHDTTLEVLRQGEIIVSL